MIKKFLLSLAAIIFAGGVLATSVMRTTAKTVNLPEATPTVAGVATSQEESTAPKVEYYLPYPGILPDHFLYPLKMVRDKAWLFLTRDPLKKAEVLLLFADKRVNAAKALIEGGKEKLGLTTMTKAEKYLEQAVSQAEKAQEAGKEVSPLYEKLTKASLKHEEVLTGFMEKVSDEGKSLVGQTLSYPEEAYQKVRAK